MSAPLVEPFAIASLIAQSAANLLHRCTAQSTADGRTWANLASGTNLPCRLSRPSPGDARPVGDTALNAASTWVLALEPGSPFAGARVRYVVTGSEHGVSFSRTVYGIGALTPIAQTAESRVLCSEDPLAVVGA